MVWCDVCFNIGRCDDFGPWTTCEEYWQNIWKWCQYRFDPMLNNILGTNFGRVQIGISEARATLKNCFDKSKFKCDLKYCERIYYIRCFTYLTYAYMETSSTICTSFYWLNLKILVVLVYCLSTLLNASTPVIPTIITMNMTNI